MISMLAAAEMSFPCCNDSSSTSSRCAAWHFRSVLIRRRPSSTTRFPEASRRSTTPSVSLRELMRPGARFLQIPPFVCGTFPQIDQSGAVRDEVRGLPDRCGAEAWSGRANQVGGSCCNSAIRSGRRDECLQLLACRRGEHAL